MSGDPFWRAICAAGLDVPSPVAALHRAEGRQVYRGRCDVEVPDSHVAQWMLRRAGFPPAGRDVALQLICEEVGDARIWTRDFGGCITRSALRFDTHTGRVIERFGLFSLSLSLLTHKDQLHVRIAHMRVVGLPVPRWLIPHSSTVEFAHSNERFGFDVAAHLPFLGGAMRYRGWLDLP